MSMKVKKSTVEDVRKRFDMNKKKLEEKEKEYDFNERMSEIKEEASFPKRLVVFVSCPQSGGYILIENSLDEIKTY